MVFPDDTQWQADWKKVGYSWGQANCRWRSWGTEELLIRAVRKNMPWLRRIYILLARESQVQPWMEALMQEGGVEVRLVFHHEFMPEQFLPCFVSRTIEMFLEDIPGLSECFLYGNDDMFPLSPLQAADFFREGKPCQHAALRGFPKSPTNFHIAALAGLNMIARDFGLRYGQRWLRNGHSIAPYLRSACREVWKRHGEEIVKNIDQTKRTAKAYNQYLYFYWQHFAGLAVDHMPPHRFVNGAKVSADELREIIHTPQVGILCINDNENIGDWQAMAAAAREALREVVQCPT